MKKIVKLLYLIPILYVMFLSVSCEKQFLEKPTGSDLIVDSIFATERKAMGAISQAYSQGLAVGFPLYKWILQVKEEPNDEYGMLHGTVANISDETYMNNNWSYDYHIISGGMTADNGTGAPLTEDAYVWNWTAIRACYLTIENIDKVTDMSDGEKEQVKAEMKTIIAYRYQEMLKRYGGVPIVEKTFNAADDMMIPRASIEEMITFIETLCDEAATILPDSYPPDMVGRVTKGVALSVKAEAHMFAARPLFNSAEPYLSLGGENNKFICFGNSDASRWEKAIEANLQVIDWAANSGHYLINTGSPLEDYGVATSEPGNPEIILAYKWDANDWNTGLYAWFNPHEPEYGREIPIGFQMLEQYYKEDGTDQIWLAKTDTMQFSDYFNKCDEMEPRFKASICKVAGEALNNPGDLAWSYSTNNGIGAGLGNEGCGSTIKFWANAGDRKWMEFPIYRLAENYLNLAEAYNEVGNSGQALNYLNIIRERAGVPDVTETNKEKLRGIIQREWAVEFFEESHRLYDIKHWKIASEIMGTPRYRFVYSYTAGPAGPNDVAGDFNKYWISSYVNGFWSPSQYLVPFPVKEINKGYLVQNPGY
ncbi:MAG: RagB/SusD family nutrient uptake outer membrane protein [Prolixibacteraceae bacterium]